MTSYNLGPLEQEVMECLWEEKNVSVSDVHKCLQEKRKIAYTTVMTIMTRLTEKGFLIRKMEGKAYLYSPKKSKKQTAKNVIKRIVNSLVDQYGHEAVTAFTDELKRHK
ncbi:MAG: Transcriptional repressor, CopY family [Candidatus Woesebacteria bacterium GW2011_GWB1_38_8]|uniref:Transcriptional repressor, CopY family n=1 Tax=Candidatus Woesebacteria bacterium GW2011_GWB1_38_8 TaxID=1618570 RepID=A0A0G0NHW1_9BACT|nr:MAG: Transcriptional repressor, CopY family [Candidatus Woesebacteria bacterium GW2011_GWB1_38_8]